jgi:hypothetical protein
MLSYSWAPRRVHTGCVISRPEGHLWPKMEAKIDFGEFIGFEKYTHTSKISFQFVPVCVHADMHAKNDLWRCCG